MDEDKDEAQNLLRSCALAARLNPDRMSHRDLIILYGRTLSPERDSLLRLGPYSVGDYQRRRVTSWYSSTEASLDARLRLIAEYVKTGDVDTPGEYSILVAMAKRAGVSKDLVKAAALGAVWTGSGRSVLRILTERRPTYEALYAAFESETNRVKS